MAHDEAEADKNPEMDPPQLKSSSRKERGYWTGASNVGSLKEPKKYFERLGLVNLQERVHILEKKSFR